MTDVKQALPLLDAKLNDQQGMPGPQYLVLALRKSALFDLPEFDLCQTLHRLQISCSLLCLVVLPSCCLI